MKNTPYQIISDILYQNASRFKKKHGDWLVQHCRQNQVVFMDTWNGQICQADCDFAIEDDGYVGSQLHGKVHIVINDPKLYGSYDKQDCITIYQTLLKSIKSSSMKII